MTSYLVEIGLRLVTSAVMAKASGKIQTNHTSENIKGINAIEELALVKMQWIPFAAIRIQNISFTLMGN